MYSLGNFFSCSIKKLELGPKKIIESFRASDISQKKSKILRDFQGHIRGKIGRFRGIFAGKKSKFVKQSANFGRFLWEKSQNLQKNRPISRDFSRKKSIFEGFSGANS